MKKSLLHSSAWLFRMKLYCSFTSPDYLVVHSNFVCSVLACQFNISSVIVFVRNSTLSGGGDVDLLCDECTSTAAAVGACGIVHEPT